MQHTKYELWADMKKVDENMYGNTEKRIAEMKNKQK